MPSGASGSDNVITGYTYNAQGHLTQTDVDTAGGTTFSGGLDAQSQAGYDDLGTEIQSKTYAQSGGLGTPRTTLNHFPVISTTTAGGVAILDTPSHPTGVQSPVSPSASPAPLCPDSATTYCNSVAKFEANGLALATIDAYGHPTTTAYNFAGKPVQVTQAYDPGTSGHGAGNDRNLITLTRYDLAGRPSVVSDSSNRSTVTTYDNLGRPTMVTHDDSTGTPISDQKTVYLASGRVDRVGTADTVGVADGDRTWTKTLYDLDGRAVTTLVPYNLTGAAGLQLESFEETPALSGATVIWDKSALGSAIAGGATESFDTPYAPVAPHTGTVRLDVTTSGTANQGVAWSLPGTYADAQTYDGGTWINASAGTYQVAFADSSGTVYGAGTATAVSGSTWTYLASADWTVSGGDKTGIRLIVRQTAGSGGNFYLDDAQAWNKATPASNIPSSTTVYDADGRTIESVLPPASVSTSPSSAGSPEVTTVAEDNLGQQVAIDVNAANAYSAAVAATTGLQDRYPLDERSGTAVHDRTGSLNLAYSTSALSLAASSVDQASTAVRFDGATQGASATAADLWNWDQHLGSSRRTHQRRRERQRGRIGGADTRI